LDIHAPSVYQQRGPGVLLSVPTKGLTQMCNDLRDRAESLLSSQRRRQCDRTAILVCVVVCITTLVGKIFGEPKAAFTLVRAVENILVGHLPVHEDRDSSRFKDVQIRLRYLLGRIHMQGMQFNQVVPIGSENTDAVYSDSLSFVFKVRNASLENLFDGSKSVWNFLAKVLPVFFPVTTISQGLSSSGIPRTSIAATQARW